MGEGDIAVGNQQCLPLYYFLYRLSANQSPPPPSRLRWLLFRSLEHVLVLEYQLENFSRDEYSVIICQNKEGKNF